MGRKKKEKRNKEYKEEIDLIPIDTMDEDDTDQTDAESDEEPTDAESEFVAELQSDMDASWSNQEADAAPENVGADAAEESVSQEETGGETEKANENPETTPDDMESESSSLFGAYVSEENKWERKNRIKDEKIKAKEEKKRAKYADVDDETYEQMKVGGTHKFWGVLSLMLLIAGMATAALFVYRLVIAPAYARVGEKERNLQVEGFATETDTSKYEQQVKLLQGIATPSDLVDTWIEQPFEQATPSDGSTQDMDGVETLPSDQEDAKPVVEE